MKDKILSMRIKPETEELINKLYKFYLDNGQFKFTKREFIETLILNSLEIINIEEGE